MKKFASLSLLLGCVAHGLSAQISPEREGDLENVSRDTTGIFFEQRLYRNPMEGLLQMRPDGRSGDSVGLIPLVQGVPVGAYRLGNDLSYRPLTPIDRQAYRKNHRFRPWNYLLDFRLQPEVIANFGNPTQTVQALINLMLQSQVYLWRGMALHFGVLFPVMNNLDGRPNSIRPAPFYLNQFLALGTADFVSASAGFFRSDRYGLNVQYQHADLNARWTFGVETGLTGFYYYPRGGIYYDNPNELLLLGNVAYRFNRFDFTTKLTAGRYLDGDWGARLDFVRQFTNVEIALFAISTQHGSTLGFNFAVPIPPGKVARLGPTRLRTTEEFRWEYAYARGYGIGNRYRMGYQLDERLRQYHRSYLVNQWRRLQAD